MLKAGGTATAAGTSVASQGTPHVLQSPAKLSKLAARLQRNGADQVASVLSTPMRKEEPRPDQHMSKPVLFQPPAVIIAHHENYGDLSSSPMAVASVGLGSKSELEALLKEKQHWLRVMHEDNGKMAVLLKVGPVCSSFFEPSGVKLVHLFVGPERDKDTAWKEDAGAGKRTSGSPPSHCPRRCRNLFDPGLRYRKRQAGSVYPCVTCWAFR